MKLIMGLSFVILSLISASGQAQEVLAPEVGVWKSQRVECEGHDSTETRPLPKKIQETLNQEIADEGEDANIYSFSADGSLRVNLTKGEASCVVKFIGQYKYDKDLLQFSFSEVDNSVHNCAQEVLDDAASMLNRQFNIYASFDENNFKMIKNASTVEEGMMCQGRRVAQVAVRQK